MPTADLGNVVSSFAPTNILYDAASGKDLIANQTTQNALMQSQQAFPLQMQEAQQKIGGAETQMMARAAGALLAEPDLAKRTALYPQFVSGLQAQGFAKLAPSVMPDESHLRALFALGTSPQDQLQYGFLRTPGSATQGDEFRSRLGGGGGGTTGGGGGGGGTAKGAVNPYVGANLPSGVTPDEDQLVRTIYGEAGNQPVAGQQAVAHVIKTRMKIAGQGVQDTVFAPNQFEAWVDPRNRPRMESLDPNSPEYQRILTTVVRPVMTGQAQDPTGGATNFVNPTLQAQLGRAQPGWAQGNRTRIGDHDFYYGGYGPQPTAQQAVAAPGATPGAVAPPAPYRVAGAVVAPPVAAAPASGAQPAPPPVVTPTSVGGVAVNGMAAPPQAVPQQQAQAQPPAQPPPQAQQQPPAQMPPELQTNERWLTPADVAEFTQRSRTAYTPAQIQALENDVEQRRTFNAARQDRWLAQQHQTVEDRRQAGTDARAVEQLRLAQEADKRAQADADVKARQAAQPFQGQGDDAQNRSILLKADPKSDEYHSAYASFADPKIGDGGVIIKHNMQPYRLPQDQDGNPITTYDQPIISIGPGDLPKLRAFETGAASLKSALDDFASTSRKASTAEVLKTVAGLPTDLGSSWTNAALMAKGTALFDLGVLSGPDMSVIRGALADPSTFFGSRASTETIDKQVARIKTLLDTRLDQARRSYGGGMSTSGAAAPSSTADSRPPLTSFDTARTPIPGEK